MLRDLLKSLNLREKQFSQKGELQPTRITVPFPPQKIGRNAQFSYNIEKRNSRVDENYSKRGENYANFVIFEQRNASILGPIIVSLSQNYCGCLIFASLLSSLTSLSRLDSGCYLASSAPSQLITDGHTSPGGGAALEEGDSC